MSGPWQIRCYSNLADLAVLCDGPLAAVVKMTVHMDLPAHREAPGAQETCRQDIEHTVTLLRDSDRIALHTKVCNKTKNHRMRILFPARPFGRHVLYQDPLCHDAVARWKEPGWECAREQETFVHPSQGVSLIRDEKAAVAVYTRGLYEVAVSGRRFPHSGSHTIPFLPRRCGRPALRNGRYAA